MPFLGFIGSRIIINTLLFSLLLGGQKTSAQVLDSTFMQFQALLKDIVIYQKAHEPNKPLLILFASTNTCSKCYEVLEKKFVQHTIKEKYTLVLVLHFVNNVQMLLLFSTISLLNFVEILLATTICLFVFSLILSCCL